MNANPRAPTPRLVAGAPLPELVKTVTQQQVEAYARASGDFNPIHLDEEFASRSRFGRRIAHGMLILAFVSEMMSAAFPQTWASGGRIKVRFKAPVYPGETVTTFGSIVAVRREADGPVAHCVVGCRKADGAEAIAGRAVAPLGDTQSTGQEHE